MEKATGNGFLKVNNSTKSQRLSGRSASLVTGLIVILSSQFGLGARFLVTTRNSDAYQAVLKFSYQAVAQLSTHQRAKESMTMLSKMGSHHVTKQYAQIETLNHLRSFVLNTEDPVLKEMLARLPGVLTIEEDEYFPLPWLPAQLTAEKATHLNNQQQGNSAFSMEHSLASLFFQQTSNNFYDAHQLLNPQLTYGLKMIEAPKAIKLAKGGQGVRIMIIDSGIDREHPLIKSNYEQGENFISEQTQGPYPEFDHNGHGTHVAGTAAGVLLSSGLSGVAPQAKILAARVCTTACSKLAVIAAINWAIEQKVDVVNLSLGGPSSLSAEQLAFEALEQHNIVAVAASGNFGRGVVSYPAAYPTVIAVGAVTPQGTKTSFSNWGKELDIMAPGEEVISSIPSNMGRVSRVQLIVNNVSGLIQSASYIGSATTATPLTAPVLLPSLTPENSPLWKESLLLAEGTNFNQILQAVRAARQVGAKGVVLYSSNSQFPKGGFLPFPEQVPVVSISKVAADHLIRLIQNNKQPQLRIQVLESRYYPFSGTSMASPHVAGVVALMKAVNKKLTPNDVRSILAATAKPIATDSDKVGAGLVNALAATEMASRWQVTPSLAAGNFEGP
ncbi:MAG: S8 family serine peptidase [Bdellovibrionaceae bacterium]|nr:S8 family serine peptidase [Pseudobdellovibrionaceae bacterium]MDW8189696.1 S8 family serine peptidase [Pseudobdellovibrionaceae bacterium]